MANKSYALTANKVYAGIPTSVANDVAAGVWTPTADEYGRILDASWDNLPINEFVAVAGSRAGSISDYLASVGLPIGSIDYGSSGLRGSFNAWVGSVVDHDSGRVFVDAGGGHVDSSLNGCWEYNLEHVFGWTVFDTPSDPHKVGFEWVPEYRDGAPSYTNYPDGTTPRRFRATTPDGRPTSSHTYAGVWFNSADRVIETSRQCRKSRKVDVKGASVKFTYWQQAGSYVDTTILAQQFYDEQDDTIKGYCRRTDIDATNMVSFAHDSNMMIPMASGYNVRSASRYNRKMYCFSTNSDFRVLDLDSLTFETASQATTWQTTFEADQEMVACVYVPQWNKIIRRFSAGGRWILFDPVTLVNNDWTPAGDVPETTPAIGNKYFYYEKRKCVVCISVTTDLQASSIFIMRIE